MTLDKAGPEFLTEAASHTVLAAISAPKCGWHADAAGTFGVRFACDENHGEPLRAEELSR